MTLAVLAKLLGVVGAILTLIPALHVLIATRRANRHRAPPDASPGAKDLGDAVRDGTTKAHTFRFTTRDLFVTAAGLAFVVLSFGLDLLLTLQWIG